MTLQKQNSLQLDSNWSSKVERPGKNWHITSRISKYQHDVVDASNPHTSNEYENFTKQITRSNRHPQDHYYR